MNRYGIVDNFTLGNQVNTVISYDQYGFVDGITSTKGGTYLQNWSYDFNNITGNLTRRTGLNSSGSNVSETFTYDDLNRLVTYMTGRDTLSVTYDGAGYGNITAKTDVGTYGYTGGVHNVTSVTEPTELMQNLSKQFIDYTKSGKVSCITDTLVTDEVRELNFIYGPDENRVKTLFTVDGAVVKTKYFALGQYEKETDSTGNVRELYYVSGADGVVAVLEKKNNQDSIFYIHKDYLGSYEVISNQNGTVKERYNFDPCFVRRSFAKAEGRRRNPAAWSYNNIEETSFLDRGFTGHEHGDQFGLINMLSEAKSRSLQASGNGRVYDPLMAMFLSPDNFVQSPDLTQNLNRYTYCLNNPLKFTDPSGYNYLQYMQQHYQNFDYRGGYYSEGQYYQRQLGGGGYAPAANISYDAQYPEYEYHYDSYLGKYRSDLTGEVVEWEEAYNNEVLPNALAVIDFNELRQNLNDEWQKGLTTSVGWPNDAPGGWGVNFQGDSKLTVGVQAGGDIGGLGGKYGVFVNLCSITLIGHEGTKLIYPGSQSGGMTQINQGLTGGLGVGAGVSHTFDGSFEGGGYSNETYSIDGGLDKGIFSIKYNSTPEGETLDIGFSIHVGLILGFEGNYKIRIKW